MSGHVNRKTNMNITLRKIRHARKLSRDSHAFTAELMINDKHAGYVSNKGEGGPSFVRWDHLQMGEDFKDWADQLPPVRLEDFEEDIPMSGDLIIDLLIDEDLEKREQKRNKGKE